MAHPAGEDVVFIAAHAIQVMVMHHPHYGTGAIGQRLNELQVGHFMNVEEIRLEGIQRLAKQAWPVLVLQRKAG